MAILREQNRTGSVNCNSPMSADFDGFVDHSIGPDKCKILLQSQEICYRYDSLWFLQVIDF